MINVIEALQVLGIYSFTRAALRDKLGISDGALKSFISRQVKGRRAVHLRRGYYSVVPVEYLNSGAPPASWFIDGLMKHLSCTYYVGLLTAAELYGASHHKPQVFQVVTEDSGRPISAGRNLIRFYKSSTIKQADTVSINTSTGYMSVSTAEQTLIDLVRYMDSCGGTGNVVTVFSELAPEASSIKLKKLLKNEKTPLVQRVGLLLEAVGQQNIALAAEKVLANRSYRRIPLSRGSNRPENSYSQKWKVFFPPGLEPEA